MIDHGTIDRIMDAAQIVDVVSDFVTLRKRGVNYVGLCPFHDDKTPSFYVSPSKGLCKCFACGKGGNGLSAYADACAADSYQGSLFVAVADEKIHGRVIGKGDAIETEGVAVAQTESVVVVCSPYADVSGVL